MDVVYDTLFMLNRFVARVRVGRYYVLEEGYVSGLQLAGTIG
jgi:hypothetical protein